VAWRGASAAGVSILIPIWRLQLELFRACLGSIAAQEYRRTVVEVMVCFDGTPPTEVEAATAELEQSGLTFRTITFPEQRGMAEARNACALAASREWLLPLDHDDALTPDAISQLVGHAREGIDLVYSNYQQLDESGRVIFQSDCSAYHALLLERRLRWDSPLLHSTFILQTQLIRTAAFQRSAGFDPATGLGHEVDFRLRLFDGENFGYVHRVLYLYNQRPGSTYHTRYAELVSDTCMVMLRHLRGYNHDVTGCCRLGKVGPAQVTHYGFFDYRYQPVTPDWVDYSEMRLRRMRTPEG
jgi:glycosyltransferase involved in cell wall biosynthesis